MKNVKLYFNKKYIYVYHLIIYYNFYLNILKLIILFILLIINV